MTNDCMGEESSVLDCSVCHDRKVLHYMREQAKDDLEEGDEIEILGNEDGNHHVAHSLHIKEGTHGFDRLIDDGLDRRDHGTDEPSEGRRHPVEETLYDDTRTRMAPLGKCLVIAFRMPLNTVSVLRRKEEKRGCWGTTDATIKWERKRYPHGTVGNESN